MKKNEFDLEGNKESHMVSLNLIIVKMDEQSMTLDSRIGYFERACVQIQLLTIPLFEF